MNTGRYAGESEGQERKRGERGEEREGVEVWGITWLSGLKG